MGKQNRIIGTMGRTVAYHEPSLYYTEQLEDETTRKRFVTHPNGTRIERRRNLSRHHPFFTKPRHKGREWFIAMQRIKEDHGH